MPDVIDVPVADQPVSQTAGTDESSLADHEASFGRGGTGAVRGAEVPVGDDDADSQGERDEKGRFRHRAINQQASADDVKAINALTKELRTKEAELAKARPDVDGDSPRVRALKRQIKALDADLGELKAPKESATPTVRVAPSVTPSASTFTDKEPTLDDFKDEADPYEAHLIAKVEWRARKRQFEAEQSRAKTTEEARARDRDVAAKARVDAFRQTKPDFDTVIAGFVQQDIPKLLIEALIRDDNGPQYVYHLAQHPELVDELFLLTDMKPVTDAHVATVQRRLKQHASAATTGSATVARPTYIPPRPPNPVRTGPIRTGEELPSDESSLAEHEKAFGKRRR